MTATIGAPHPPLVVSSTIVLGNQHGVLPPWAEVSGVPNAGESSIRSVELLQTVEMSSAGGTGEPTSNLVAVTHAISPTYFLDVAAETEPFTVERVVTHATEDAEALFVGLADFLRRTRMHPEASIPSAYETPARDVVSEFMAANSQVAPILRVIPERISAAFGRPQRLRLDLVADPDDASEMLVVTIVTSEAPASARPALARFDDSWWRETSRAVDGALAVTLTFV